MKTVRLKKLILILLIIVVLAAAVLGGYQMIVMSRLNALTLRKARWSCGGGMSGGHTSLEIRLEGDHAVAVAEKQEWHNSDLERTTYILPAEVMDQLKDLIIKNKLNVLSRRGYSKMIALDADTDHFYADFTEGYDFGVSQDQKKSPAESKRFYEVRTFMYDLIKDTEGVTEVIPAGSEIPGDEDAGAPVSKAFGDFRKLC
ncbi:MAG: hypothetical protein II024_05825 [Firmicutes bacterium]|nr:hypothetical protein [Bacillota bacterium]